MTDLPGLLLLGLRFGLAICLYLFLYWALRIVWKSLKTSSKPTLKTPPPLTLNITTEEETTSHTLISTENLIGRAGECTIQLSNTTVSTQHARIYYTQSQWWIEDLDSSNGTFLNGDQIDQPAVLTDQDHLGLGSLTGIIEIPLKRPPDPKEKQMNANPNIKLGVIGGSGLYKMDQLEDIQQVEIQTPFGSPSSPVMVGTLDGFPIGFLARHGLAHQITPGEVNYRANIFALKTLGAEKVLGISACGSLRDDFAPGMLVVPNQLLDFTKKRDTSFFEGGLVVHIGVAEPFCTDFSDQVFAAAESAGAPAKNGGSAITIEGPRFSTKSESQLYRSWGIDLIGMTTSPEAFLAREAELCYTCLVHVTDYDVWHQTEEPVSVDQVLKIIQQNTAHAQKTVHQLVQDFETQRTCACPSALESAFITSLNKLSSENKEKYALFINKYLAR